MDGGTKLAVVRTVDTGVTVKAEGVKMEAPDPFPKHRPVLKSALVIGRSSSTSFPPTEY